MASRGRRANLGAVRFYLAMTVVLAHSAVSSPVLDAHFSVRLFFAISRFCMALVLNEKYTETSPAHFYLARFFRLWPTYIVVAVLTWITLRPLGDATHANFSGALYFYFSSVSLFGHEILWWFSLPADGSVVAIDTTVRSSHAARMTQMQHMWSVGVELAFYAISPLFARRPRLIAVLLPIAYGAHAATATAAATRPTTPTSPRRSLRPTTATKAVRFICRP
jgi:peptidoglycan/LPS O-acetylase OafA/YrhL